MEDSPKDMIHNNVFWVLYNVIYYIYLFLVGYVMLCNISYLTLSFYPPFLNLTGPSNPVNDDLCTGNISHMAYLTHRRLYQRAKLNHWQCSALVQTVVKQSFLDVWKQGPASTWEYISCCLSADFYLPDSLGSNRILRYLTILFSPQSRSRICLRQKGCFCCHFIQV